MKTEKRALVAHGTAHVPSFHSSILTLKSRGDDRPRSPHLQQPTYNTSTTYLGDHTTNLAQILSLYCFTKGLLIAQDLSDWLFCWLRGSLTPPAA